MVDSEKRSSDNISWLSILSFGSFLVLLGVIWIVTPNLYSEIVDFVNDFHLEHLTESIVLPAPQHYHPVVYTAIKSFCLIFGAVQVVILALGFMIHESVDKKSGTASHIAFWFSMGLFSSLLSDKAIGWFSFLAGLIISAGLAIVVNSAVKLFK